MKILITGATGTIGHAVLNQCLKHPQIVSIVALVRRELPSDFISSDDPNKGKFSSLIVNDFENWSDENLELIKDANAVVW
jgi:nucleoside-diphosphate-sugar epimerase